MSLQADCTGYEFVLGEIYGLRWWSVDRYGRLNARSYSGVWSNGEQTAQCKKAEKYDRLWGTSILTYTVDVGPGLHPTDPPKVGTLEPKVEHVVPADDCTCGFYAFTDPTYDYKGEAGDVQGVIRGYGRTLIGAHGFRCAKAEVVALHVPGVRRIKFWRLLVGVNAALFIINAIAALTRHTMTGHLISGGAALINAAAVVLLGVLLRPKPHPTAEKLRLNYPDVPQYPTVAAMLKAHPLTPTLPPSPDSDPDFWTRP